MRRGAGANPPRRPLAWPGTARGAACAAVDAASRAEAFVEEVLDRRAPQLSPRDRAFAANLALVCLRRSSTIDAILRTVAEYEPVRVQPAVRAILHVAAGQVLFLDRVPGFAAVSEAVDITRAVEPAASGMVNAILRRLCSEVETQRCSFDSAAEDQVRVDWATARRINGRWRRLATTPVQRIEQIGSIPHAMAAELLAALGAAGAEQVAWACAATPVHVLHTNSARIDAPTFEAMMREDYADAVEISEGAAFLDAEAPITDCRALRDGNAYLQDCTARAAALFVQPRGGERVLDLCAAPGGKTIAMALASAGGARIVATDRAQARLDVVRANVSRMLLRGIDVVPLNAITQVAAGGFDAVLVDVPCSNSGVLARRPEARFRIGGKAARSLTDLQVDILRSAAECAGPAGRLVYSTCSVISAENRGIVDRFLAANSGWRLDAERTSWPTWGPRRSDWRDGGYVARLVRK